MRKRGNLNPSRWPLAGAAAVLFIAVAALAWMIGGRLPGFAAAGDFKLDFVAAQFKGLSLTYFTSGGTEGDQQGTSEGADLGFDDRTIGTDVVESLEARDFKCNDRIIFFNQITVGGTDTNQTIFLVYHFDAINNGQPGVGYSEVAPMPASEGVAGPAVGISGVDFPNSQLPAGAGGEDGNAGLDGPPPATGGETVVLVSQQ